MQNFISATKKDVDAEIEHPCVEAHHEGVVVVGSTFQGIKCFLHATFLNSGTQLALD